MRCTQVADRPVPDGKFVGRDWVIAAVMLGIKSHECSDVDRGSDSPERETSFAGSDACIDRWHAGTPC